MDKKYLEIGSSIGAVLLFILFITINNVFFPAYANFGNVAALLIFVVVVGAAGLKLSEIKD
ncbi:MAG: hypothetical protein C5S46_05705 [Candidatus Methanomarinus sp.]|jgi:asparagine N-glycosylation enzyme membrane subunit Stt3|uniref:Uncharacterized protein n=1 Tax=Candidatus Methanomarinus sp. TaxID=3386244 RepID=A0AC61SA70_9EURY|nr:MAG: hypothetical protein C5S46_05705 [ANME-2 cluster archaeon]